jgi:hypothetical protein
MRHLCSKDQTKKRSPSSVRSGIFRTWPASTRKLISTPRPPVPEDLLKAMAIQVERKTIVVKLNENRRGRFLRIQEENDFKRNCVIIPVTGLAEFKKLIDEMVKVNSEIPVRSQNGSV